MQYELTVECPSNCGARNGVTGSHISAAEKVTQEMNIGTSRARCPTPRRGHNSYSGASRHFKSLQTDTADTA